MQLKINRRDFKRGDRFETLGLSPRMFRFAHEKRLDDVYSAI
jgi:hypothetical protein